MYVVAERWVTNIPGRAVLLPAHVHGTPASTRHWSWNRSSPGEYTPLPRGKADVGGNASSLRPNAERTELAYDAPTTKTPAG